MKSPRSIYALSAAIAILSIISACSKNNNSTTPTPSNSGPYFGKVKSIIQANCLTCHSASGSWAGRPTAFDSDSAIAAQHAIIKAAVADPVTTTNHRMPQTGSLSASDIDIIVQWYNKGGRVSD